MGQPWGTLGGKRIVGGPGNTQKVRLGRAVFVHPTIEGAVLQKTLTRLEEGLALIAVLIVVASLIAMNLLLVAIGG